LRTCLPAAPGCPASHLPRGRICEAWLQSVASHAPQLVLLGLGRAQAQRVLLAGCFNALACLLEVFELSLFEDGGLLLGGQFLLFVGERGPPALPSDHASTEPLALHQHFAA